MIIGLLIYLPACGFHLRGQSSLPPEFQSIQLLGENLSAKQRSLLEQKLRQAGASLQAGDRPEQVRLKVSFSSLNSRLLANSVGSGKSIVRLSRQLIYSLIKSSSEQAAEKGVLEQRLDIELGENNLLDSDQRIRRAEESIDRALVDQLIFSLKQL